MDGRHREPELLAGAYRHSLQLAREHRIRAVAFPSLSTGAYRYPIQEAGRIALRTVIDELNRYSDIHLVRFVLFGPSAFASYREALTELIRSDT